MIISKDFVEIEDFLSADQQQELIKYFTHPSFPWAMTIDAVDGVDTSKTLEDSNAIGFYHGKSKPEKANNDYLHHFYSEISELMEGGFQYNGSLIKIEIEYSLYKCYQIFKLRQKNKLYYDKCNVYSYIVFKTIFLVYFDQFKKIYTFPYDDTKITDFILKYSSYLKKVKKNPLFKFKGNLIQRTDDSLCFMLLSDL